VVSACAILLAGAPANFAADTDAEADADTAAEDAIVPDMNFTGEPISLSFEDALTRITTAGPGYESAVLAKEAFEAQAKGQEELWNQFRTISNALSASSAAAPALSEQIGVMPDGLAKWQMQQQLSEMVLTVNPMHTLNAKLVKLARPYLEEQAGIGYEIDINKLVYNTTQVYHSVLQAREALAIAEENLRIQNEILENTRRKFDLGMVAKMDTFSAESAVQDAAVKVNTALSGLKSAKMNFNIGLDFPLMQEVVLTDTLHKADAPEIDLKASIAAALANRNELRQLQFVLDKEGLEIADLATASRYGSEYLTAALELRTAEKNLQDTRAYIELEIRVKYMNLQNLADEIASIERAVENAKEGYRLADLSYNAGMNTLVDVQNVQLVSYQAQLGLAAKILEYNLAVSDFEIATGYGTGGAY
ncbi:MAG: TolC family protein, partial [Clostridiales Family XIII bacterium]|nr:TolC family protein [Clostridiales Family XIII bacterium]